MSRPGTNKDSFRGSLLRLRRRRPVRRLERIFYHQLTPSGRALVWLWLAAGTLGQASLASPIYLLWAFATAALLVAGLLARRGLPVARLHRRPQPPTTAGELLHYEVEVENLSGTTIRDLRVTELDLPEFVWAVPDPVVVDRLDPGQSCLLPIRLRCSRRGAYTLRYLNAASPWPLGLCHGFRRSSQESRFLVYPAFKTPDSFPVPDGFNHQPGGILLSSSVGESAEFMHTREFREGDNPRHVHWASTARAGEPIVKVYHEEYFVRLALLVDTDTAHTEGESGFESAVSMAAGIADFLARRDYIIDIFAAGARVYHLQAGRALAQFENILQILACLEPAPEQQGVDWQALAAAMIPEASRLTGVVALLMDWDQRRQELVEQLTALGVGVRVLVIRRGATTLPLPALSAENWLQLAPGEPLPSLETEAVAPAPAGLA